MNSLTSSGINEKETIIVISLRQLAKLCNVSATTVSRSLREDPLISAKTRSHIQEIARKNNYRPNYLVRGLFTGRTRIVAIISDHTDFAPVALRIALTSDLLRQHGYATLFFNSMNDAAIETECLRMAVGLRVSAMIISTVNYHASEEHYIELRRENIPFLLMSEFSPTVAVPHIHGNDKPIAKEAVKHLLNLGHRRIAHLGGPASTFDHSLRLAGIKEGLQEAGLELDPRFLVETNWSRDSAYKATQCLLASRPYPTAIMCTNDEVAVGAMTAIREAGFSVPLDMSIIGYGNFTLSDALTPPLTTIAHDIQAVAKKCAEMVSLMINTDPMAPLRREMLDVSVPCRFIIRKSTGPAPRT